MNLTTTLKFEANTEFSINHPIIISEGTKDSTASTIWPCSVLLALFLKVNLAKNEPRTILELGAGLGVTALATIKHCNVNQYILQEWPDNSITETLENNLSQLNKNNFIILTGKWGTASLNEEIKNIKQVDELVMADCFYSKKTFIPLLSTISYILRSKCNIKRAICVYQHRNVNDSIKKYLDDFDLNAKILDSNSDLSGEIEKFKNLNPEFTNSKLLDFQDLFVIQFERKSS